ncbi:hypothetical protein [Pyrodictium abyssi]
MSFMEYRESLGYVWVLARQIDRAPRRPLPRWAKNQEDTETSSTMWTG